MALSEASMSQIQGIVGAVDGSFISNPLTVTDTGEVIQNQMIQYVSAEQENIDPQNAQQVVMLQPITVSADGSLLLQDGQTLDPSQLQILTDLDGQAIEGDASSFQHLQLDMGNGQLQHIQFRQLQEPIAEDPTKAEVLAQISQVQHVMEPQNVPIQPPQPIIPRPRRRKEPDIKPPVGKGPFPCDKCGQVFQKWPKLRKHMKQHEEDKPHKCNQCDQTFNIEENLRLHIATHATENPTCPECGKKFSRVASLKAHLMLHEREETLMCPECGDEFMLQAQLDNHLEEHRHEERGGKIYPCKNCSLDFLRMSELREHMKQHVKIKASLHHKSYKKNIDRTRFKNKCKYCEKTFLKPSQLIRHTRVHTGERPFKCADCHRAFNQKGALQLHMVKHTGKKDFSCQFCNKKFAQRGNLRCHIQRVHQHPGETETPLFQCAECTCTFKKLGSLNSHMSREHTDHQEIVLKSMTVTDEEQTQLQALVDGATSGKDYVVQAVEDTSGVKEAIQQILEATQNKEGGDEEEEVESSADIIKQALESSGLTTNNTQPAASVTSTIATSQPQKLVLENGIEVTAQPQVPLSLIDRLPPSKKLGVIATMSIHDPATGTMKRHIIRKLNGIRWHQCTYCTKEFKKPSDLVRHVRIHTHEKPYKCTHCFRAFAVKSTLKAHLKTHLGIKEFRCNVCEKMFSTHGSLKVHLRLHTGSKPFDCPHCEKKFRTSGHMKSHMASHFRDSDNTKNKMQRRPPRRVVNKPDMPLPDIPLQEPIMITDSGLVQAPTKAGFHQEEAVSLDRPYKCGYCTRGFKKSSHLKQHVRSHTGEKPYKCLQCFKCFVSSGVLKAHIRTHTGIKAYKCINCPTTFTTKGSLKRHVSVHSEQRPYMCPYCQKTFKRSVYCKKHMRIHKAELALQAIQEQNVELQQQPPENEVTIGGCEGESEGEDNNIQEVEITVSQGEHLGVTPEGQIVLRDSQGNITIHNPGDLGHPTEGAVSQGILDGPDLTQGLDPQQSESHQQQTIPQDAIVTDVQLQSALQQQFGNQIVLTQNDVQQPVMLGEPPQLVQEETITTQQLQQHHTSQQQQQQQHQHQYHQSQQQLPMSSQVETITIHQPHQSEAEQLEEYQTLEKVVRLPESQAILQNEDQLLQASHSGHLEPGHQLQTSLLTDQTYITAPDGTPISLSQLHFQGPSNMELIGFSQSGEVPGDNIHSNMNAILQSTEASVPGEPLPELPEEQEEETGEVEEEEEEEGPFIPPERPKKILPEIETRERKRKFRCQMCYKAFKKSSHLKQHLRSHQGEKPFHCRDCDKNFVSSGALKAHLKTHSGAKDFKCFMCGSFFTTNGSLTRHMTVHNSVGPYYCVGCNQTFKTATQAKKHAKTHPDVPLDPSSAPDPGPNRRTRSTNLVQISDEQADKLSKTNPKETMQLSEKLLIESANERSRVSEIREDMMAIDDQLHANKCPHCIKSFKKPSDLVRHIRIHTGEKPYGCRVCGRTFTVKSTLDSHMVTHEKNSKSYRCHVCSTFYSTKGSLKVHMRLHTGAKPFKCPHCEERFRTSGHRKSHINTHFKPPKPAHTRRAAKAAQQAENALKAAELEESQIAVFKDIQAKDAIFNTGDQALSQVLQVEPQLMQGQGVLPVSLSITDSFGNVADPNLAAQVLQGLEGIQLQLTGGAVGQSIQISGLDTSILAQPVQIDTNLLQQLQQPGNVNISLNGGNSMYGQTLQAADPNLIQNIQVQQQSSIEEAVNPNIIIQPNPSQQYVDNVEELTEGPHIITLKPDPDATDLSGGDLTGGDLTGTTLDEGVEEGEVVNPGEHLAQLDDDDDDPLSSFVSPDQVSPDHKPLDDMMGISLMTEDGDKSDLDRVHICPFCSKGFKRASHLKEHQQTHMRDSVPRLKSTPHKCNQCEKSFQKPSQLDRHLRIHTGERPFRCDVCDKSFNQKNALQMHQKKHTGEKPHKCPYCLMSFSQKGNLKVHIKRYHHDEMLETMDQHKQRLATASAAMLSQQPDPLSLEAKTGVTLLPSGDTAVISTITGEQIQIPTQTADGVPLDLGDLIDNM